MVIHGMPEEGYGSDTPLPTEDTRAIAVTAKVHADQLDGELAALRQRVEVLEAFVASIQKMIPRW